MVTYNHAYTLGFSLENESEDGTVTALNARVAIQQYLNKLSDEDLLGNIGAPFDTYEVITHG